MKEEAGCIIWDEIHWNDALLSRSWSLEILNEIFLNQGKYMVEILNRFGILYCKAMTTPMKTNLKLLNDDTYETVDATLYR